MHHREQVAAQNGAARPAHGFQRADNRRLLGNERDDGVENEERAQHHRQNGEHAQQRKDAVDGVDVPWLNGWMMRHTQDSHAFRPQRLGQRVRRCDHLADVLTLIAISSCTCGPWLPGAGKGPKRLIDGGLAHVPARGAAARRTGQPWVRAKPTTRKAAGGGRAGVHGDRIANGNRL